MNTTGDLTSSNGNSGPASDSLRVNPPPTFSKSFAPDPAVLGVPATLTFTIDNTASTVAATSLDFADVLPPGMTVATPANASTSCTGGTLIATSGTGMITYTSGTIGAGAICSVSVDVVTSSAGVFVNTTGDLTSSLGNSGMASDTLTVNGPPLFSKVFAPDFIVGGTPSTLTFTIDNSASTVAATGLDFTDVLPGGVIVATPANASTGCMGGTITAVSGTGMISYTGGSVAAGAICTLSVDVTSATAGMYVNTTGNLTSSLGNSGTASDTLTVETDAELAIGITGPALIHPGEVLNLTVTATNSGPLDVMGGTVNVTLPAGLNGITWTCTSSAGSACTAAGGGSITDTVDLLVGGTVTYNIMATVDAMFLGDLVTVADVSSTYPDPIPGNNNDSLTTTSVSPSDVSGTMTVAPIADVLIVMEGDDLVYQVVLTNASAYAQFDDPTSDEFTDILPPGVSLQSANLVSGGGLLNVDPGMNTVLWNGAIPPGGSVIIDIFASVNMGTGGTVINNQGQIFYDSDGDGINDALRLTDDPSAGGLNDPTSIQVVIPVPTLSEMMLLCLIGLLGLAGALMVKRHKI